MSISENLGEVQASGRNSRALVHGQLPSLDWFRPSVALLARVSKDCGLSLFLPLAI